MLKSFGSQRFKMINPTPSFSLTSRKNLDHLLMTQGILRYSDILKGNNSKKTESPIGTILSRTIDKTFHETRQLFYSRDIALLLENCRNHIKEGNSKIACSLLKKILQVMPENKEAHTLLATIANNTSSSEISLQAHELKKLYQLQYAGNFGQPFFEYPFGVIATQDQSILVTDYWKNCLIKMDSQGVVAKGIHKSLKSPSHMFQDSLGIIWICDTGNDRIVSLDQNHTIIVDEIHMKEVITNKTQHISPISGCEINGTTYLVLTTKEFSTERKLISFRKESPKDTFQEIDLIGASSPLGIHHFDKGLLVCGTQPNTIMKYSPINKNASTFLKSSIGTPLLNLAIKNSHIFLNHWKYLLKINTNGEIVFTADMSSLTNTSNSNIVCITIGDDAASRSFLLASDFSNKCIHKFYI